MIAKLMLVILDSGIAEPGREKHKPVDVLVWGSVLIVGIVLGGALVATIRKRMNAPPESSDHGGGFSLADLRGMRDRGELTEQEFAVARAKMIAKVKGPVEADDNPEQEAG